MYDGKKGQDLYVQNNRILLKTLPCTKTNRTTVSMLVLV